MKFSRAQLWLVLLVLLSGSFSAIPSHADEMDEPSTALVQSRAYIGGFLTYMGINNDNDFSGNWAIVGSSPFELDLVPGIRSNLGFGFLVGYRMDDVALEVTYMLSDHTYYWAPGTPSAITGSATYQSIKIEFKRYLFTGQPAQPFVQVGLANPWISYADASDDGLGKITTFTASGLGFDLGAGMEFYLDRVFSITGGVFYRWGTFDHAYGARKVEWTIIPTALEGDSFDFYSGMTMKVW